MVVAYGCGQPGSAPSGRWSIKPIFSTNSSKIKCLNRNLPFFGKVGPFSTATLLSAPITCCRGLWCPGLYPLWFLKKRMASSLVQVFPGELWDEVRLWIWRNSGGTSVLLWFVTHLVNFLCFIYLFVLNESMSLLCVFVCSVWMCWFAFRWIISK